MGFFKKLKLAIWLIFNRDKYSEYIRDRNKKLIIFNRYYDNDDGELCLLVLTDTGEVLKNITIQDGMLEEAKQVFGEEIKLIYNGAFDCDYEIITIMPDDILPERFERAGELYLANKSSGKLTGQDEFEFNF